MHNTNKIVALILSQKLLSNLGVILLKFITGNTFCEVSGGLSPLLPMNISVLSLCSYASSWPARLGQRKSITDAWRGWQLWEKGEKKDGGGGFMMEVKEQMNELMQVMSGRITLVGGPTGLAGFMASDLACI